jgi:hypothetical protein
MKSGNGILILSTKINLSYMNNIKIWLTKDNIIFGIFLGLTIFCIGFGLIYLVNFLIVKLASLNHGIRADVNVILAIALNVLSLSYYFRNVETHKTARGILFVTFLLVVIFFTLFRNWSSFPGYFI